MTRAILDYNTMDNWCCVIVSDKKSIPKTIYDSYLNIRKVVYLDIEEQHRIFHLLNHFEIYDQIPFNHFGRKNLGYLYAMMNGAKYIYDTDDDNRVVEPFRTSGIPILEPFGNSDSDRSKFDFDFEIKEFKEMSDGSSLIDDHIQNASTFNIFLLCSTRQIWPRGFDITQLTESFKLQKSFKSQTDFIDSLLRKTNGIKETKDWNTLRDSNSNNSNPFIIQQWLANIDPDYDALGRLIGNNIDFESPDFMMEYRFDIDTKHQFAVSIPNRI